MVYVFLGGGIGSVLRYVLFLVIPSTSFPYATFIVNVIGSFLIGFLFSFSNTQTETSTLSATLFLLLTAGLCGGFTTFSTFSKENFVMLQQQQWSMFLIYTLSSLLFCIAATALGFYLSK